MRTVLLKSTVSGALTLAHPQARVGRSVSNVTTIIFAIRNVPFGVALAEVVRRAALTMLCRHFDNPESPDGYSYEYSELGAGKIVR